jgi:hypothetical protein
VARTTRTGLTVPLADAKLLLECDTRPRRRDIVMQVVGE